MGSDKPENGEIDTSLIFDIGMHLGLDTKYYLSKGFKVISLEANPELIARVEGDFKTDLESKRLTIVQQALSDGPPGSHISFYVNPIKEDWSSTVKARAEHGGHTSQEISVPVTDLAALFDSFGTPYYIKCDIEGSDIVFVRQLSATKVRPAFVSVEVGKLDLIEGLKEAGYERFQFVNQLLNGATKCPKPAREGQYVEAHFNGHMSGLFGKELPKGKWVDFATAIDAFTRYSELKALNPALAPGWIAVHATTTTYVS